MIVFRKILLIFLVTFSLTFPITAYEKDEHDKILQLVLFGSNKNYSESKMDALNAACYLAIDYFNDSSSGVRCRKALVELGVKNLPGLTLINYSSNGMEHERYTHLGWNHNYGSSDKANWEERKKILINSVDKICKFKKNEQIKKEAFSALCYYVHILGDHENNAETTRLKRIPLTSEKGYIPNRNGKQCLDSGEPEQSNPTICNDLIFYIGRLFKGKEDSLYFINIMNGLTKNENRFRNYEKIDIAEYRKCATEIIKLLQDNIPYLLQNEEFFNRGFGI